MSFTKEYPRAVVYADPRKEGGLDFVIAAKPLDLNVWEIQQGETRDQFTSRIETDACPDGAAGVLMVTRVA